MRRIIILTDYKKYFGSKWSAIPANSGFDIELIKKYFSDNGLATDVIKFSEAVNIRDIENKLILYTSSEDGGYHYKSFLEDVILHLQESGAELIPSYEYLRANNNKVYMELIRNRIGYMFGNQLKSWVFGTLEEMKEKIDEFSFPIVIKKAVGAMSKGVYLANNQNELMKTIKSISRTPSILHDIKDNLRPFKYKGYKADSLYRNKFILQTFIPNLKNDWKILIFGEKYFVLTRHTRNDDFRASGSHTNYLAGSKAIIPNGLLEFAKKIFDAMNLPHLSIDVVYDEVNFHLIEFQAIYFGTSTIKMSDVYFSYIKDDWVSIKLNKSIEEIYVDSVIHYLNKPHAQITIQN